MGNFWYSDCMRLLFVADGRSPIAINWIRYFTERGDDVYLASTFPCTPDLPLKGLELTPVAYSRAQAASAASGLGVRRHLRFWTALRNLLGPLTIPRAARRLRDVQKRIRPDLVHAMRIPFEGMLAADAYDGAPLLISVWGNDLTLHAPSSPLMRHYTSWALGIAQALHADCRRDLRLAREWGFAASHPALVIPGNGGIRTDLFRPPQAPVDEPVVMNPRGARSYVRTEEFLKAIPLVLDGVPNARFLCPALAGNELALAWIERLHISHAVQLLPPLSQEEMAVLFQRAQVVVSPSVHDGTPNSLLEGMACGCLPVAGDLESIREWITPGQNGLLVDATDERQIANAILEGLVNKDLRQRAAGLNREIVLQRADYARCMPQAEGFYQRIMRGDS
jgi:glycosyltransferase involved in cell wall biosynthesis